MYKIFLEDQNKIKPYEVAAKVDAAEMTFPRAVVKMIDLPRTPCQRMAVKNVAQVRCRIPCPESRKRLGMCACYNRIRNPDAAAQFDEAQNLEG